MQIQTISKFQHNIYYPQSTAHSNTSKPSRWNWIIQKGQKYSDESSIHGIRYFAGSDKVHRVLRILWLLIFCSSIALGMLVFKPIWIQYSSMATQTSIDFIEQDRFNFPSITFRNLNMFRKSMVGGTYEPFLHFTNYRHDIYSDGNYSCASKTLGELAFMPSARQMFEFFVRDMEALTATIGYAGIVAISTSTSMNSVQMCRFQGRMLTDAECYSAFQNRMTNYGYVFTFNPADVIRQFTILNITEEMGVPTSRATDSTFPAPLSSLVNYTVNSRGRATAMEFVLNAQEYDFCNAGENDGAGFEIQIHDRDVQPVINELMNNVIQLTPGKEITISIKESHIVRETEKSGRCTSKNDLDYYGHLQYYDQNACFTECITKKIRIECDCVAEFAPSAAFIELVRLRATLNLTGDEALYFYGYRVCTRPEKSMCVRKLIQNIIVETSLANQCSRCKTPCFQKNYIVHTTENIFPAGNALHIYRDYKYPRMNYTALTQISGNYHDAVGAIKFLDARMYNLSNEFATIEEARSSLVYLRIQLEDMNIMVTRETFAVSISELFTQLGGAISLFTGASVLSFIELFYWILIPEALRSKNV